MAESDEKTKVRARGRFARFANVFLPVSEVSRAASNARKTGSVIAGAVGTVVGRLRAVLRREEDPQPTVIDEELQQDQERQRRALGFARLRWCAGVLFMLLGIYQFGGAVFTHAGFIASVNFVLSAVLVLTLGAWLSMVGARDAAVLQGASGVSNWT
jgi:hypothetical protein